jgi:hypothetical protein
VTTKPSRVHVIRLCHSATRFIAVAGSLVSMWTLIASYRLLGNVDPAIARRGGVHRWMDLLVSPAGLAGIREITLSPTNVALPFGRSQDRSTFDKETSYSPSRSVRHLKRSAADVIRAERDAR